MFVTLYFCQIKRLPFPFLEETTHALCTFLVSEVWCLGSSLVHSVLLFDGHWKEIKLVDVHREELMVARS